mgnify:CR=1 FL=1
MLESLRVNHRRTTRGCELVRTRDTGVRRRVPGSLFRQRNAWLCTERATTASCSGTCSGSAEPNPVLSSPLPESAVIAVGRESPPKHCLALTPEKAARRSFQTMVWSGTSVRGPIRRPSTERGTGARHPLTDGCLIAMCAMQLGRSPATAHHNSSDELYCQRSANHTSNSSACMTLSTCSRGTPAFMAMAEA